MSDPSLTGAVAALWAAHCGDPRGLMLRPAAVSGNNRVFVATAGGVRAVAKWYYTSPSDTRDRLETEWGFLGYAAAVAPACVPRPIACDRTARVALYEHVEGRRLEGAEVDARAVAAAAGFFTALNPRPRPAAADRLPAASEACFSIAGHIALVDRRLACLSGIVPADETDAAAVAQAGALAEHWAWVREAVLDGAERHGFAPEAELASEERCLSPSDFGFHNALLRPDGRLCFLDFEYAGWDDPAKMAADFFFQPAVPVDTRHRDAFERATLDRLAADAAGAAALAARARLLRPVFGVKWCCILMNIFVPDLARRSRFAAPGLDEAERKRQQLAKASSALKTLIGS